MRQRLILVLTGAFLLGAWPASALGQGQAKEIQQIQEQEQVFGWQLMSEQERQQYRQQMRQMKTVEEREAFRKEHHEMMKERARQQGVTLPDEPSPYGKGMGPGRGMGPGGGK